MNATAMPPKRTKPEKPQAITGTADVAAPAPAPAAIGTVTPPPEPPKSLAELRDAEKAKRAKQRAADEEAYREVLRRFTSPLTSDLAEMERLGRAIGLTDAQLDADEAAVKQDAQLTAKILTPERLGELTAALDAEAVKLKGVLKNVFNAAIDRLPSDAIAWTRPDMERFAFRLVDIARYELAERTATYEAIKNGFDAIFGVEMPLQSAKRDDESSQAKLKDLRKANPRLWPAPPIPAPPPMPHPAEAMGLEDEDET